MKLAWIVLTVLLLAAVVYLGHQQPFLAKQSSTAQGSATPSPSPNSSHRLADSMQRKLDHIRENGESPNPDSTPTVITEEEANDYFAAGRVKLPQGVKNVVLEGKEGVIDASVDVDFDAIRAGQRSSNPLLSIFTGVHKVQVVADAAGSGGEGKVHVRNIALDGVEVPRTLLEIFVAKFVTPKYPNVGLDSHFQMPSRIDAATVGYHKLTVVQK